MEFSKEAQSDSYKRVREMENAPAVFEAEAKRFEAEGEKLKAKLATMEAELEQLKLYGHPPNPEIELARVMNQRLCGLAIILGGIAVAVSLIITGRF